MATEYKGIKLGTRRMVTDERGRFVFETHTVHNATSSIEAQSDPNVPRYGNAFPQDNTLAVQNIETLEVDRSRGTWEISIQYSPPSGNIPAQSTQVTEWNFGATTEHIDISFDGELIGSRTFWNESQPSAPWLGIRDEDATIGTDVIVPSLEIDVTMPIPSQWNPFLVKGLIGRCNSVNFIADGITFAAETVLFSGAQARRVVVAPAVVAHEIHYKFIIAEKTLPTGLPLPALDSSTGGAWSSPAIPISRGYYSQFQCRDRQGNFALTQEDVASREPMRIVVYKAYATADLRLLGIG